MRGLFPAAVLIPMSLIACGNDARDGLDAADDVGTDAVDSAVADTEAPDVGAPDTDGPDAVIDVAVPDVETPDVATPDVPAPDVALPDIGADVLQPTEQLLVSVHWDTPGDPDQTDEGFGVGTDVDLHLLHPNGCWEDETWDCHYAAQDPTWAQASDSGGDPSMDLEDIDGAGPEIIRYDDPIDGLTYRIGVHYYEAREFGPSTASVRIYIDGEVAWEGARLLEASDDFWEVAAVAWPERDIRVIDRVTAGVPACD